MDWNWLKEFLSREHSAELAGWKHLKGNPIKSLIEKGLVVPGTLSGSIFRAKDPDASIRFREDDRVILLPLREWGTLGEAFLAFKEEQEHIEILVSLEDNVFKIRRHSQRHEDSEVLLCPSKPIEEEYEALGNILDQCLDGAVPQWDSLLSEKPHEEEISIDSDSLFERLKILKDETTSPLVLVQGPPGTGKTHLIGRLINEWLRQGRSVLLAAFTNRAVDEMLRMAVKVAKEDVVPLFRAGRDRICEELSAVRPSKQVCPYPSGALGTSLFKCATAIAKNAPGRFDIAVIDEASQVKLPSLFAVALLAKTVVVVGDHRQLPPVILQEMAKRPEINAYRCSAFEYLVRRQPHFMMRETYRLNRHVCSFVGHHYYEGKLQSHPEAADKMWPKCSTDPWLQSLPGVCHLVVPHMGGDPRSSTAEAIIVTQLIERLEQNIGEWMNQNDKLDPTQPPPENIPYEPRYMVSCLFRHQAALVRQAIRRARIPHHLWHVDTVERNQGQTASVAILCVGAKTPKSAGRNVEWVLDPRRWNVALSRGRFRAYVIATESFSSVVEGKHIERVVVE